MTPPPRYTMGPHIPGWENTATYGAAALTEAWTALWWPLLTILHRWLP